MSTSHKGAIRPKNTQSVQHANGTESTVKWISEPTVIKRIRRALAKKNHTLLITREGTQARRELGEYAIFNERHELELKLVNLRLLAVRLGVLADHERIDQNFNKGWKHYVARQVTVEVDGVPCLYNEPVTRVYSTPEAARKAAEAIEDRAGLVLCGFDAGAKGGTNDGSL